MFDSWGGPLFWDWGITFSVFAALPFAVILLIVALTRNRSPWWALLGFFSLPGLIVGLVILLMDEPAASSPSASHTTAERIAKERFARGEIGEAELRHILETLRR